MDSAGLVAAPPVLLTASCPMPAADPPLAPRTLSARSGALPPKVLPPDRSAPPTSPQAPTRSPVFGMISP
jgi:hypothetical protein